MSFQKTLLKQQVVKSSRKLLIDKLGVNIHSTRKWKTNLTELPKKIKNFRKSKIRPNLSYGTSRLKQSKLIHLNSSKITPPNSEVSLIKSQQYEDLQKYSDTHPFLTRRGLLIDALQKFSKGDILYSVANDEKLLWYIWRKKVKGEIIYKKNSFPIQEDGILLYDFYQSYSPSDKEFIKDLSEIIPLLNLQDEGSIYFFENVLC